MKSLRLGLVDLDTSHPGSFVPLIRAMGHEVTGVFDSGTIHPPGYAEVFAREHHIEAACEVLEELIDRVDAVMIHSCNWDMHVKQAQPFIEAGKAVFIDKPLAGKVGDLQKMMDWAMQGAVITGGSALRYCSEVVEWRNRNSGANDWLYGLTGCSVDEFNYGIHAYTMLHALLGSGIEAVRDLGGTQQRQVELTWQDGRKGIISIGKTEGYLPFYTTAVTQNQVEHIRVDNSRLYQSLLDNVLPYLAGVAPAPIPFGELVEVEMAAIAAKRSAEQGGALIRLQDIPHDYMGYDGTVFARYYKSLM
ncbi:Gfo/Idh/MocA family protein [Paenibacillus sp. GXUN7292]|uniref:Gfo/Idh/MocA family protein n=1 Tax=Paenibacillus sp. GXUN7292 TaxID=3422499 RepID=UPI003D7CBFC8